LVRVVFEPSETHTEKDARSLVFAVSQVTSRDQALPMLTDARGTIVGPDRDARDFYGSGEAMGYASCSALLVDSVYQKFLANFFQMFTHVEVPFRVFNDEAEAISWLDSTTESLGG